MSVEMLREFIQKIYQLTDRDGTSSLRLVDKGSFDRNLRSRLRESYIESAKRYIQNFSDSEIKELGQSFLRFEQSLHKFSSLILIRRYFFSDEMGVLVIEKELKKQLKNILKRIYDSHCKKYSFINYRPPDWEEYLRFGEEQSS